MQPVYLGPAAVPSEFHIEVLQYMLQVEVRVFVEGRAGRSVRLLRDPDVGEAIEQALGAHARLRPRERRTRTAVHAGSESEVLAPVRTVEAQLVGGVELAWIAVGRGGKQHHGAARPNRD